MGAKVGLTVDVSVGLSAAAVGGAGTAVGVPAGELGITACFGDVLGV